MNNTPTACTRSKIIFLLIALAVLTISLTPAGCRVMGVIACTGCAGK